MARYTKPFARSGAFTPAAVELGRHMLGALDEQRRLSPGTPTRQMQRTMPDGTVVVASFAGELARVHVIPGSGVKPRTIAVSLLQGLVVQPRTFAAADAFGAHPEAVLMPMDAWRSFLFNDTYAEAGATVTGYYERMKNGQDMLVDGLPSADKTGWTDWRSGDEMVALCWRASLCRYFANGNDGQYSTEGVVYYNGHPLINVRTALPDALGYERYLAGAALKGTRLLLAIVDRQAAGFMAAMYLRFYETNIEADTDACPWFPEVQGLDARIPTTMCPRLKEITDSAEVTRVLSIDVPEMNGQPPARFFFNQDANECRAILHDDDFGDDVLRLREVVVDWRAHLEDPDEAVTYTDTELAHATLRETTDTVYAQVRVNALNGVYRDTLVEYMRDRPYDTGGSFYVLPLTGTVSDYEGWETSGGDPIDWLPIGVDYQDNVPVYLYAQPEKTVTETEYTGSATGDESYASSPFTNPHYMNADSALDYTVTKAGSRGFGLRAVDKDANVWLEVTCARSQETTYTGTASMVVDAPVGSGPVVGSATIDYEINTTTQEQSLALHFIDLRTRSACYSKVTIDVVDEVVYTAVGLPVNSGFEKDYDQTGEAQAEYSADTRVIFFGEEVAAYSGTHTPAATSHATSGTTTLINFWHLDQWGWAVIGAFTPLANSGYALSKGADGIPPFPDWNTPYADYPASNADSVESPGGLAGSEFQADGISLVTGSWPWTHHDPSASVYVGAWGTFKDGWAYSMADLSGALQTPKWVTALDPRDDMPTPDPDLLSGAHGLESFGQIWPLSTCIHNFTKELR